MTSTPQMRVSQRAADGVRTSWGRHVAALASYRPNALFKRQRRARGLNTSPPHDTSGDDLEGGRMHRRLRKGSRRPRRRSTPACRWRAMRARWRLWRHRCATAQPEPAIRTRRGRRHSLLCVLPAPARLGIGRLRRQQVDGTDEEILGAHTVRDSPAAGGSHRPKPAWGPHHRLAGTMWRLREDVG